MFSKIIRDKFKHEVYFYQISSPNSILSERKKITFYVHNVSYYSLQIWVRTWDVMKINLSCEEKNSSFFYFKTNLSLNLGCDDNKFHVYTYFWKKIS